MLKMNETMQGHNVLATDPEVPGLIPGASILSEKQWVWNRVVGDDGFITTVTTVTQQRESPDNSDLQELLDKLAQEKH
uniref:Uncharacterized protein n=1 Tax=Timema shepardi TaxID=629360 RepID=A0A7R9APR4_TIMSH|nr:unnamed protein product [Timema shepardi]